MEITPASLVDACGGADNLRRVLRHQDKIIIELIELERVNQEALSINTIDHSLRQITLAHPVNQNTLTALGRLIDYNLREQAAPCYASISKTDFHRPTWHISPPQGLLNDPNGFIYFQGHYHLFYQWYPFACEHKDKFWVHLISPDGVQWRSAPLGLTPSDWYDSHGVFSGHAMVINDALWLYYTGNTRIGPERLRQTTQCVARSTDGIHFEKLGPVIDAPPAGVTEHIRDPKVIYDGEHYRMLLGAQREDKIGRLAQYSSIDGLHWRYDGLSGDSFGDHGYMWECPDLFPLNDQWLCILCPQGSTAPTPDHHVPHHNGYAKATLEADGIKLDDWQILDHGFDFYAPQTAQTPDNKRMLIAWMGLPDEVDQPSQSAGWLHQLTCPRELRWENGQIYQRPATALQRLRGPQQLLVIRTESDATSVDLGTKQFELSTSLPIPKSGQYTLYFHSRSGIASHATSTEPSGCALTIDGNNRTLTLDRSTSLATEGDTRRCIHLPEQLEELPLQVLADTSSLEFFISNGQWTMTSRYFSATDATFLAVTRDHHDVPLPKEIDWYALKKASVG
ncbi:hypothetical protein BZG79_07440 [Salinivibrio sp. MA427]|uniref:glycoside hydrolase family 32 protein n=1 Tax=unclassified Salinivibrio TaxID=2636825 RepID=UPI0009893070|nr:MULTISPECIES: glycoside hydrolase family 32 protein [unclassified Salinivibrio]OOF02541.1 hypothetical protein BZG80_12265 [Salinivibrio sp. MA440]OOF14211.1 hypothetical protein BZG79_07440 [Salinivibrio sp. MA427]